MIHKITIPTPFAVGDVNAFLLKGDTLSLIDAGPKTPDAYEALNYGIQQAGYSMSDIEQVILTHHHPDHAGWIDAFEQATITGHVYNDLWLRRDENFLKFHDDFYMERLLEEGVPEDYLFWVKRMKRSAVLMGVRPLDHFLAEGDQVAGHPDWTVMETPGHAQSHIVLWNEKTKEIIGGDLILEKVSSNPLIEPPLDPQGQRPRSLLQYNASMKRLLTIPVDVIYTGHGNEVHNAHALIKKRLVQQHDRAMKVLAMMDQESKTVFELTQQLFPAVYEKELGLTLSETIGQIDYLVDEGFVNEKIDEQGVFHYEQA